MLVSFNFKSSYTPASGGTSGTSGGGQTTHSMTYKNASGSSVSVNRNLTVAILDSQKIAEYILLTIRTHL